MTNTPAAFSSPSDSMGPNPALVHACCRSVMPGIQSGPILFFLLEERHREQGLFIKSRQEKHQDLMGLIMQPLLL